MIKTESKVIFANLLFNDVAQQEVFRADFAMFTMWKHRHETQCRPKSQICWLEAPLESKKTCNLTLTLIRLTCDFSWFDVRIKTIQLKVCFPLPFPFPHSINQTLQFNTHRFITRIPSLTRFAIFYVHNKMKYKYLIKYINILYFKHYLCNIVVCMYVENWQVWQKDFHMPKCVM